MLDAMKRRIATAMPTAEIKVKQPREPAGIAGLAEMAVYGDAGRALIHVAIDALE